MGCLGKGNVLQWQTRLQEWQCKWKGEGFGEEGGGVVLSFQSVEGTGQAFLCLGAALVVLYRDHDRLDLPPFLCWPSRHCWHWVPVVSGFIFVFSFNSATEWPAICFLLLLF